LCYDRKKKTMTIKALRITVFAKAKPKAY
jgi:hypothetical protein